MKIDPVANTGEIYAEWQDENGHWTYHQRSFAPPPHPTGLRLGTSETELELTDPVTTNVYLHGDTTATDPVLPTVFNYLATWGPAEISHNGIPFNNVFDGPEPNWVGHTMTTEGVRGSDGSVRTTSGAVLNFLKLVMVQWIIMISNFIWYFMMLPAQNQQLIYHHPYHFSII